MDGRTLPRIGAFAFVGIAITVAIIETRQHSASTPAAAPPTTVVAIDPLQSELARCRSIGQAGASDPECLHVWEQARRRFLGTDMAATQPLATSDSPNDAEPASANTGALTPVVRSGDAGGR